MQLRERCELREDRVDSREGIEDSDDVKGDQNKGGEKKGKYGEEEKRKKKRKRFVMYFWGGRER